MELGRERIPIDARIVEGKRLLEPAGLLVKACKLEPGVTQAGIEPERPPERLRRADEIARCREQRAERGRDDRRPDRHDDRVDEPLSDELVAEQLAVPPQTEALPRVGRLARVERHHDEDGDGEVEEQEPEPGPRAEGQPHGSYRHFILGAPSVINTLQSLHTYDTFWVNSPAGAIASLNPSPPPGRTIQLQEGWNNFTYTGTSRAVSDALAEIAGKYTVVAQFDNPNSQWLLYHPPPASRFTNDFGGLFKLKVYWVYMTQPATLTMN